MDRAGIAKRQLFTIETEAFRRDIGGSVSGLSFGECIGELVTALEGERPPAFVAVYPETEPQLGMVMRFYDRLEQNERIREAAETVIEVAAGCEPGISAELLAAIATMGVAMGLSKEV